MARWLVLTTLAVLVLPASAWATTTVSIEGSQLKVTGTGESHYATVTHQGTDYRVTEGTATVAVGPGCTLDTGVAVCPEAGITNIFMQGNQAADKLTVDPAITLPARLEGGDSLDDLRGGGGDDTLLGGPGDDKLWGYGGADVLDGEGGTDLTSYDERFTGVTVTLDTQANDGGANEHDNVLTETIDGSKGDDLITGSAAGEILSGNDGSDTLHGGGGDDSLYTGYYDSSPQFAYGDDGNDYVQGAQGDDTLEGGNGDDSFDGYAGAETIRGGDGNDTIRDREGTDILVEGGPGDDVMGYTANGALVYDGGPGYDYIDLQDAGYSIGLDITMDGVANDHFGGTQFNVMNFERLGLSSTNDHFVGSDGPEVVDAIGGADVVETRGGDDYMIGAGQDGPDLLDGGDGVDTADYQPAYSVCTITLDGIANDGPGSEDNVLAENVVACPFDGSVVTGDDGPNMIRGYQEDHTLNGAGGDDLIFAGYGTDTVNGGDGDDHIYGEGDNDTIHGDAGDDRLEGGIGADLLDGGDGEDVADYDDSVTGVIVTLDGAANDGRDVSGAAGHQPEGDNVQTDDVIGTLNADTLTGDAGPNRLMGGGRVDDLHGGAGDDVLDGGQGADLLDGGADTDTADYSAAEAALNVSLDGAANDGRAGEYDNALVENVFGSGGADTLTGDGGPNRLEGGDGPDTLTGDAGDDVLIGGAGGDAFISGAGADRLLARDGEADTLECDVREGKVVFADAAMDISTTCDIPEDEGGETDVDPPPAEGLFGPPDPPVAPTGDGSSAGGAAPLASMLQGMPRRRAKVRLSSRDDLIDLGDLTCTKCSATAVLRAGKRKVAAGHATADEDHVALTARLTKAGWRRLKRDGKLVVTVTIVLQQGAKKTTIERTLVLRRAG